MGLLHNLREVFKTLKHRGITEESKKYCPRCGNPKLKLKINWSIVPSQTYKCADCGYEGPIFMEKEQKSYNKTK